MDDPEFQDSDSESEQWKCPLMIPNSKSLSTTATAENIKTRTEDVGVVKNKEIMTNDKETTKSDCKIQTPVMSRMALNTNKAGMEGLDKDKINAIILNASKGSKFYENEQKKECDTNQRVAMMKQKVEMATEKEKQKALKVMDRLAEQLESERDLSRTIVHLDMDAFYAAVEMRDNPALLNKPMAVGDMSMLCTSNYLARRFGVRAGMPGFIAKKLCPDLILVPTNFDKYRKTSKQVQDILKEYDPNFCPMSLDEAYLDLTEHIIKRRSLSKEQRTYYKHDPNSKCNKLDEKEQSECEDCNINEAGCVEKTTDEENPVIFGLSDEEAVNEIRFRIHVKTQLTASAGIAPNTMLSKVCSDKNKPNGQYKIEPTTEAVMQFVRTLPIRKISGIGKVTEKMLKSLNIETCSDLFVQRAIVYLAFSEILSHQFLEISLGLGSTRVQRSSERKSISVERTFRELSKPSDLYMKLNELCKSLSNDLQEGNLMGKTITIKLKTIKFEVKSRSYSLSNAANSLEAIYSSASELLRLEINACQPDLLKLRLMGVRMSSLGSANAMHGKQGTLHNFFQKARSFSPTLLKDVPTKTNEDLQQDSNVIDNETDCGMAPKVNTHLQTINESALDITCASYNNFASIPQKSKETIEGGLVQFTCPICNIVQSHINLDKFNEHVDMCLNEKEIKSILSEQDLKNDKTQASPSKTSPSKASKRSCDSETSTAKRRRNDSNQSLIEEFLKADHIKKSSWQTQRDSRSDF